jgi:ABC-type dipeptide/oligopeptide/nickel transport system ATPase subunit
MLKVKDLAVVVDGINLLEDISFSLEKGRTLCILGESGAGKSTLIKALQGLMPIECGEIIHQSTNQQIKRRYKAGENWYGLDSVSWVMQNPLAALNPKQRIADAILEGLYPQNLTSYEQVKRLKSALNDVHLPLSIANRFTKQLSIGQAQRVCLARALITKPSLVLFDEPLSALDAIVQKKIAHTMHKLKIYHDLTYVVVTHDLGYASAYADEILVLKNSKINALQSANDFFNKPQNNYCLKLLESAISLGSISDDQREKVNMQTDFLAKSEAVA